MKIIQIETVLFPNSDKNLTLFALCLEGTDAKENYND